MSLVEEINSLVTRVASEFNAVRAAIPTWSTLGGKPAVVAAGATQAEARTAIGAGTSSLAIGTTSDTAKAGNYTPATASSTAQGIVELATTTEATTGTDTSRAVTAAGVKAVADTKAPAIQAENAQTGTTYTYVAADAGKMVTHNNAAAVAVTVPANVFSAGQRIDGWVLGAGMVTLVAGSGLTLLPESGLSLVTRNQRSAYTIWFRTATAAFVTGSMAAA